MKTKAHLFFYTHPIFNYQAFVAAMNKPPSICKVMLAQHVNRGNILHLKRELYASIPVGADPATFPVDPYLIINALAKDAVTAYHSALQFHGIAYTAHFQYVYLTDRQIGAFTFRHDRFLASRYPTKLFANQKHLFVDTVDHLGCDIKITSVERTLVDVLDRINLSGGLEEVWRSLSMLHTIQVDKVIDYACCLKNTTTIAKLGFYLTLRQQELQVSVTQLDRLKTRLPRGIHYLDRQHRINGKYIKEWRLVVPTYLMDNRWEEILDIEDI